MCKNGGVKEKGHTASASYNIGFTALYSTLYNNLIIFSYTDQAHNPFNEENAFVF